MLRGSFTFIEMLFSIVILSFVLIGGFQIVEKIYIRNYIAKETSKMEFVSQSILDEVSSLVYFRVPLSVIGYNPQNGDFKYIGEIKEGENYPVLEWIGYLNDAMVERNLSGFIDLYESKKPVLRALDFSSSFINDILSNKFNGSYNIKNSTGIIFAGTFDRGEEVILSEYNDSFGWHDNEARYVFIVNNITQDGNDCNLSIKNSDGSDIEHIKIYEKFYLADSAYAIALGSDINKSAGCIRNLNIPDSDINNALFLFYNYRPWEGETFCADLGDKGIKEGNATLLAENVKSFRVKKINYHLELKIELLKQKGDINISVAKQKVAF